MVWAGRVLLIVLIASTLFVAKQSDLQTETAIAQQNSGSIRILTNDLTFSVVGSGIATATQAKINHQTEVVYVNGIKIQNTTAGYPNFDLQVFFDLTFYLSSNNPNSSDSFDIPLIGNNTYTGRPGICGNGTARLFGGTLQPYETRTIPTNLACADISYYGDRAQFTAGSIPDGQNSASLNIVLHPNDNVILPNALIWPAAKITVTDLFPTSGGTHYMSLRLPDNSTRPSLSGTLFYSGGTTQSFGAALLDPPGTNYTINHSVIPNNQNPAPLLNLTVDDYAMYEQTVSVTKPNVQLSASPVTITAGQSSTLTWASSNSQSLTIDKGIGNVTVPNGSRAVSPTQTTTYTITARAQSGATATATATVRVTNDLPDLVVDLSQVKARVDGSVKDKAFVSADTTEFKVTGIRVSNIGKASAPAGLTLNVGLGDYIIQTTLPEIAPSQSIEVGELDLLAIWKPLQEFGDLHAELKSDRNFFDLKVEVNPNPEPLTEKDFSNNKAESIQFASWPAARIKVEVASDHTVVEEAVVTISLNGKKEDELTDNSGTAYFTPLAKPGGSTNYTVTVSFEGEKDIGKASIEVRDYVIYDQTIVIDPKDGLVIEPYLLQPDEYHSKPSDFVEFEAKGAVTGNVTVVVVGARGKLLTHDLLWGRAKFSELKTGEKVLVKSISAVAVFDVFSHLKNQRVTYRWSEKVNGPLEIEYQGDRQEEIVEIKLITNCEAKTTNGKIKICIYDDEESQATAQKTWLPVIVKTLDRMTKFNPPTALTITQEEWVMTSVTGGGHFDPRVPEYLFLSSRLAATDNLIAADFVMHEAMHAIDFQNGVTGPFSGLNESFAKSVQLTSEGDIPASLSRETGIWTWENLGWFCGVAPARVKDICDGHNDPSDGPEEVWAEQMTTLCLLPAELKSKIANYEAVYQANPMKDARGNVLPPPVDLEEHVSILASRSVGDNTFAPGRGYVIWGANGYNTMVPNVLKMANSCDPGIGRANTP